MQKKIGKIGFDFEIITFELVALKTVFYWKRIHFIGCQYVPNSLKISDTTNRVSNRVIKKYDKITAVLI